MRIQHNIMAMGAYRNYTNNLNAMKKNLEKLSSGYKINRAGDDAAGLAISEKMRAQITGLTTAQKNAKDGISLVQTAEGALTEVHDMLNRMVELATQSANGTYDNETDRAQLQKEVSQLLDEINRIADSSNFNGIKLLDGSMDSSTVSGVKYQDAALTGDFFVATTDNKGIGGEKEVIDGKEIWETEGGAASKAGFEIDMDGTSVTLGEGETFTLTIADAAGNKAEVTITGPAGGKSYTSSELAKALADQATADGGVKIKDAGADATEHTFNVKADGKKLVFTTDDKEDFKLHNNATVTWTTKNAPTDEPDTPDPTPASVSGELQATTSTALDGTGPVAAQYKSTPTIAGADTLIEGDTIDINGDKYVIVNDGVHDVRGDEVKLADVNTEEGLKKFIAEKLNDQLTNHDVSVNDDGDIVFEAYAPGVDANDTDVTGGTFTVTIEDKDGATHATASATVAAPAAAETGTGAAAVAATKFIKLSDADNDALAAAAEAAGAADGANFTIKVDAATSKAQLFAGDTKIAEADYTADGATSTTVTFKDDDGNALMKASLVNVEGDEDLIADGFDTGLTFTAASEGTASGEAGLVAYAEGDTGSASGTPSSIDGTASGSIGIDGTSGTPSTYKSTAFTSASTTDSSTKDSFNVSIGGKSYFVDKNKTSVADQATAWVAAFNADAANADWTASDDGSGAITITAKDNASGKSNPLTGGTFTDGDGTNAAKVVFTAAGTAETTEVASKYAVSIDGKSYDVAKTNTTADQQLDAWIAAYNADSSNTAYTASKDGTSVVLTEKVPSAATSNPTGMSGGTWTSGTAGTATLTADASGLNKDAIKTVADGIDGIADGEVKISLNADNKLELKIGDKLIGVSTETVDGSETTFTMKGVDDNTTALGTITLDSGVDTTDFDAALSTGLTYTAATSGTEPVDPDTPEQPADSHTVMNIKDALDAAGVTDFNADTAFTGDVANAVNAALAQLTDNKITLTGIGTDGVDVNLTGVTDGAQTIGDVAKNIFDKAKEAIDAYNATSTDKQYEVVSVSSDPAGNNVLFSAEGAASQTLEEGTGFYIQTREVTNTDTDEESTVKASGTINKGLQNVTDNNSGDAAQLANTVVNFDEVGAWSDGAKITIGDTTYTVALGEDSKFKNASNVVDLTDLKAGDTDLNKIAAERLTVAANGNSIFSVGHDGNGNTTLQQRTAVKESTDMSDHDKIASYLGVSTANANSLLEAKPGNGLTLQIGDTAESFNQLKVDIKDMHAESLGLKGLDISTQAGAADAISKIKAAINTVSDVRGTLGATQNRLDHTINNLSVMTENIQDAESTIRDTDVADEMMAYTKNNILIQSAQAMLAQANQVPQGVLQLLQ